MKSMGRSSNTKPYKRPDRDGWWCTIRDEHNKRRRLLAATEEEGYEKAVVFRSEQVRRVQLLRDGLVTQRQIDIADARSKSIEEALRAFSDDLRGRRKSERYIFESAYWIRRFAQATGYKSLGDVRARGIRNWLGEATRQGRSAGTYNHMLNRVRTFLWFCTRSHWLDENPASEIRQLDAKADRRATSRALTHDELTRLLSVAKGWRRCYYLFGARAGLRWLEISRLKWRNIDLDRGWLLLTADITKARRADDLPIADDLREAIIALKPANALPGDLLFEGAPDYGTWHRDLVIAGVIQVTDTDDQPLAVARLNDPARKLKGYKDDRGRILGVQSLRKTFGTHLAMVEPNIASVAKAMRHTNPKLTQELYLDARLMDLRGTVNKLAPIPKPAGGISVAVFREKRAAQPDTTGQKKKPGKSKTA